MIARIGPMSVVLAMLVAATPCLAADPAPGHQPGKGGIGALVGVSSFRADRVFGAGWFDEYSEGAQMRFAFAGNFRYIVSPSLRWQISPGFTWSGYKDNVPAPFVDRNFPDDPDKSDYLTLLLPVSAQIQYVVNRGRWVYHVGAGPGLYRVWVQNHRKVLKDPVSFKLHRKIYPGASGQLGVEKFLTALPNVSLEGSLAGHLALAQDDDFVSGIDSNLLAIELKVGTTYYFGFGERKRPSEGALPHERKE